MIIDSFIFFNELDVLEGRLRYLYDSVDYFVIVESNLDHSGNTKPLLFTENQSRFQPWLDKIVCYPYLVVPEQFDFARVPENDHDFAAGSWQMENGQRNHIAEALHHFPGDAVVMVSDVDEIPHRDAIGIAQSSFSPGWPMFALRQDYLLYNFGQRMPEPWSGTVISTNQYIQQITPQGARTQKTHIAWIDRAGWHLTYWGTPEQILTKIQSFAHQELNRSPYNDIDYIRARVAAGQDLFGRPEVVTVPMDSNSIPQDIQEIFGDLSDKSTLKTIK